MNRVQTRALTRKLVGGIHKHNVGQRVAGAEAGADRLVDDDIPAELGSLLHIHRVQQGAWRRERNTG